MIDLHPGPVRFVAFSLVNGEPYTSGSPPTQAIDNARDLATFGIGHHPRVEVLDCGHQSEDVLLEQTSLAFARSRFPTVYRAQAVGSLPALSLSASVKRVSRRNRTAGAKGRKLMLTGRQIREACEQPAQREPLRLSSVR